MRPHTRVAVEATAAPFRALIHVPTGETLDGDGRGLWPADQFTFRLIGENALRRVADELAPADAPSEAGEPAPDTAQPEEV